VRDREAIAALCEKRIAEAEAFRRKAETSLVEASYTGEIIALRRVAAILRGAS
jgi:hypothetical protein